jgi:hypothetical protein
MKNLNLNECQSIIGGDLFSYDMFYAIGTAYIAFVEYSQNQENTPGTNSYTTKLKMGGL